MWQAIVNAIRNLTMSIFQILVNFFWWIAERVLAAFNAMLDAVGLPSLEIPDLGDVLASYGLMDAFVGVNEWVPLYETLICISSYSVLYAVLTPVKMVLRRIPTVGGG